MLTVVGVALVLFLLVTMVLTLVTYQVQATTRQQARAKALHIADAGINAYLYQLRKQSTYWSTNPTLGPVTLDDGYWTVVATPAGTSTPLTLRSTGIVPGLKSSRTVVTSVRFPSFADYMFLSGDTGTSQSTDWILIGADATIIGKVRSNNGIDNAGHITGSATAVDNIIGAGPIDGGKFPYSAPVDFAGAIQDVVGIKNGAIAAGTYFAPPVSPAIAYRATFTPAGTGLVVERVTGKSASGITSVVAVGTYSVPGNGLFFFDGDVYISGAFGIPVTVASSSDIYVTNNLTLKDPAQTYTCGLIADSDVLLPIAFTGFPTDMTLQACLLARQGTIKPYPDTGSTVKNSLTIFGSESYAQKGWMAMSSGGTIVYGFLERTYNYDGRANDNPPPGFPVIHDGSLRISTWVEQGNN
jgi:hypothetical protein